MRHTGTQRIETKRLILRRFEHSDAAAMFNNWASSDDVTKYLSWPPHPTQDVTLSVINDWVSSYSRNDFYQWAIVLKKTAEPIGSISVVSINEDVSAAEMGYCIGEAWWHQGIASEALRATMRYLFDVVGVNRIEAHHDPHNPRSGNVMKACGMRYEGTLRSSIRSNQGICDACLYASLASDQ